MFCCFYNPLYDTAKDLDADCAKIFISKLRSGRSGLHSIIIILTFAPFTVYIYFKENLFTNQGLFNYTFFHNLTLWFCIIQFLRLR